MKDSNEIFLWLFGAADIDCVYPVVISKHCYFLIEAGLVRHPTEEEIKNWYIDYTTNGYYDTKNHIIISELGKTLIEFKAL